MAFFAVFDQHFFLCQLVQIFVKKSLELHIVKCISHTFQELFSEVHYLYYFLSYVVIEFYKCEKTYCTWKSKMWRTDRRTHLKNENPVCLYSMFFHVCKILWRRNSKSSRDNWLLKKVPGRYERCILRCVTPWTFWQKSEPLDTGRNVDQKQQKKPFF